MKQPKEGRPRNPFEWVQAHRDVVRDDECDHLFKLITKELNDFDPMKYYGDNTYEAGLSRALDILDERMMWLRDRWRG